VAKSQREKFIAWLFGVVIMLYFIAAMVLLPSRPGLVVHIFLIGFGLCLAGDVATSIYPKIALFQPMRWLRSAYLSGLVVGAIYFSWMYFDEGYDVVMIGTVVAGILIGEFVLKLQVLSLLSRMGDDE
jgi:hypothetical protein